MEMVRYSVQDLKQMAIDKEIELNNLKKDPGNEELIQIKSYDLEVIRKQLSITKQIAVNKAELHKEINGSNDPATVKVLTANVENYERQLDELLGETKATNVVEIASQEAQEKIFSRFERISYEDITVTLRDLAKSEIDYQILSGWIQTEFVKQAEQHAIETKILRDSYERQIQSYADDLEEVKSLRDEIFSLKDQLNDEKAKHDAAANRALEAEEESKRLSDELKTVREQLEKPKEPVLTNTSANLAELMKQRELAKPAITNLRWKDELRKNAYLATLVSTNEEIEFGVFDKGLYREVTTEEAERFRAEQQEQTETVEETVEVPALDLTPPSLQVPDEVDAVQGDTVISQVVLTAEEVTEKLNDLEQRIKALEVA